MRRLPALAVLALAAVMLIPNASAAGDGPQIVSVEVVDQTGCIITFDRSMDGFIQVKVYDENGRLVSDRDGIIPRDPGRDMVKYRLYCTGTRDPLPPGDYTFVAIAGGTSDPFHAQVNGGPGREMHTVLWTSDGATVPTLVEDGGMPVPPEGFGQTDGCSLSWTPEIREAHGDQAYSAVHTPVPEEGSGGGWRWAAAVGAAAVIIVAALAVFAKRR